MPLDDTNVNMPDYSNHIPAPVRRQAERAEEISRQVNGERHKSEI